MQPMSLSLNPPHILGAFFIGSANPTVRVIRKAGGHVYEVVLCEFPSRLLAYALFQPQHISTSGRCMAFLFFDGMNFQRGFGG